MVENWNAVALRLEVKAALPQLVPAFEMSARMSARSTVRTPPAWVTETMAPAVADEKNEDAPSASSAEVGPPTNSSKAALAGPIDASTVRSKALTSPQSVPSPVLKYTFTTRSVDVVDEDSVDEDAVVEEAVVGAVEEVVESVVAVEEVVVGWLVVDEVDGSVVVVLTVVDAPVVEVDPSSSPPQLAAMAATIASTMRIFFIRGTRPCR